MRIEGPKPDRPAPWYRLSPLDGVVIDGVDYRVHSSDARGQLLYETSRPTIDAHYSHERWAEVIRKPGFQHFPRLHDPHRVDIRKTAGVEYPSDIPRQQFMWMHFQECMVLELIFLHENGLTKLTEADVQAHLDGEMGKSARRKLKLRQLGAHAAGAQAYVAFDISAPSLLKKRRVYLKKGFIGLRDGRFRSGRKRFLSEEVAALLALHIAESISNPSANPTSILDDIQDEIDVRNEQILANAMAASEETSIADVELMKAPNIKTVRKAFKRRSKFEVDIGRFGLDVAVQLNPAVRGSVDALGPLERIEYDESIVDAITLLTDSGVWAYMKDEEKKDVKKGRMVIGVAICVVTRVIVGMRIYRQGNGAETVATFRMITEDKTRYIPVHLRDRISWHQHGGPASVVVDQGSNNISDEARTVLANLDVPVTFARAARPDERGTGERIFRTLGHRIYSLLDARTGSNVLDRKNYRPEDCAPLTEDELWEVLCVGIAGIYHNSPHSELGGRTPAMEWDRLAIYGTNPPPDPNRRRVTFGIRRKKPATRYGVACFGLSYTNPLVDHHALHGQGVVEVAGDPEDISAVSVRFGDTWYEALCTDREIPLGVRWIDWKAACQPLKDLAHQDAAKRRAARRAAKEAIKGIQERARDRLDRRPLLIDEETVSKGERTIFGKYEHADDDQDYKDGALGTEVMPDNDEPALPIASKAAAAPATPTKRKKPKSSWSVKP